MNITVTRNTTLYTVRFYPPIPTKEDGLFRCIAKRITNGKEPYWEVHLSIEDLLELKQLLVGNKE